MWFLLAAAESDRTGGWLEGHGQQASSSPALAENRKQDVLQITWSTHTKNYLFLLSDFQTH